MTAWQLSRSALIVMRNDPVDYASRPVPHACTLSPLIGTINHTFLSAKALMLPSTCTLICPEQYSPSGQTPSST